VKSEERVVVVAPAKLNLCLHVGDRREDGYHDLESLVAFASIGDVVTLEASDGFSLALAGPFAAALSEHEDNLAVRAARLLALHAKLNRGARISLTKNLPVAAGMGGGSADAAAVLRGLVRMWDLKISNDELRQLGASLGADVPVCIESAAAWMEGKGESVTRVASLPSLHLLLVNPLVPVPTGAVFSTLRDRRGLGLGCPDDGFADARSLICFLQAATNDLEAPARMIAPEVGTVLQSLADLPGAMLSRMSGSGGTCFGVFEGEAATSRAGESLRARHPEWWVRETTLAPESAAVAKSVQ
jgi:4-diphosphocytidyl-2-C-methyl-D-erythritol kinase